MVQFVSKCISHLQNDTKDTCYNYNYFCMMKFFKNKIDKIILR